MQQCIILYVSFLWYFAIVVTQQKDIKSDVYSLNKIYIGIEKYIYKIYQDSKDPSDIYMRCRHDKINTKFLESLTTTKSRTELEVDVIPLWSSIKFRYCKCWYPIINHMRYHSHIHTRYQWVKSE